MRRVAVMIALVVACSKSSTATSAITAADATRFAGDLIKASKPCDPEMLARLYDHGALMARARERIAPAGRATLDEIAPFIDNGAFEAAKTCVWVGDAIDLALLRVREVDGAPRPLLRKKEMTTNFYFELSLARDPKGRLRLVDVRSLHLGAWMSDEIANVAAASTTIQDQTAGRIVMRVRELDDAGRNAEALAALDELPPEIHQSKPIQDWRVELASSISPEAHIKAVDDRAALFPDLGLTPSQAMMYAISKKDRAGAHAAIDALERDIGGDPDLARLHTFADMIE